MMFIKDTNTQVHNMPYLSKDGRPSWNANTQKRVLRTLTSKERAMRRNKIHRGELLIINNDKLESRSQDVNPKKA